MQSVKYRVFIDNGPLAQSDLDSIDTVVVQQEMDQIWSATLVILVCTTERGHWEGEDDSLVQPLKQVRIEIAVGPRGPWVPLIDGPIVGYDAALSPEPSQSTITARVADDSIRLWRTDDTAQWTGDTDSDKASSIFNQSGVVSEVRTDSCDAGTSDRPAWTMQRGTLLDTLRALAANHPLFHAWVAAGSAPGQSIGMFKKEDTRPSGLPPLVLLGDGRNMDSFSANADQQRPANVTSWQLNLSDLSVSSATASYGDQVGSDSPVVAGGNVAQLMVPPGVGYGVAPDELAQTWAAVYGQAFDARGTVRSRCYDGVLQPYKMVEVKGVNGLLSGNYVIKSVTHTLARSEYTQEFGLLRRGQSGGAGSGSPLSPPAGLS